MEGDDFVLLEIQPTDEPLQEAVEELSSTRHDRMVVFRGRCCILGDFARVVLSCLCLVLPHAFRWALVAADGATRLRRRTLPVVVQGPE